MSKFAASKTLLHTAALTMSTVTDSLLGRIDPNRVDEGLVRWSNKMLDEAQVTLVVRGREHLRDGREAFVLMSNHQSHFDIPVLYRAVPFRIRMVGKAELFRIPLFGRAMHAAGFVEVNRENRRQAVESLRQFASTLDDETHLWIAPEGTRSVTGELGSFKSGGFHVAFETGRRILPIAIDGTRQVLPSGAIDLHRGRHVRVTILEPIDPRAFGPTRRKDLVEAVRNAIGSALPPASV